jgi:uncharacterized OB-fold protein
MSVEYQRCKGCGTAYFPSRYVCHRCRGTTFDHPTVSRGRVICFTQVYQKDAPDAPEFLVEIEAAEGMRIIATSEFQPSINQELELSRREDSSIQLLRSP